MSKRRKGTGLFGQAHPTMLHALGPSKGVYILLDACARLSTPSFVEERELRGKVACIPAATIAKELRFSEKQVNNGIAALKRGTVTDTYTGKTWPLLRPYPGHKGRKHTAAAYIVGIPNEGGEPRDRYEVSWNGSTTKKVVAENSSATTSAGSATTFQGAQLLEVQHLKDIKTLNNKGGSEPKDTRPMFEPGRRLFYAICPKCGKRASAVLNDRGEAETRDACGSNHIELPEDRKAVKNENGVYVLEEVKENI